MCFKKFCYIQSGMIALRNVQYLNLPQTQILEESSEQHFSFSSRGCIRLDIFTSYYFRPTSHTQNFFRFKLTSQNFTMINLKSTGI